MDIDSQGNIVVGASTLDSNLQGNVQPSDSNSYLNSINNRRSTIIYYDSLGKPKWGKALGDGSSLQKT